ncbi:MAG: ferredoxin [Bacilli bacterium]
MEKLNINQDKCIGCGMCVGQNSEYFDFNDEGKSSVIKENIESQDKRDLLDIIEMCPTEAINIDEE